MRPLQKSGLFLPNSFGLIILKSLEEALGLNGLNAILNLARLNDYIGNPPPENQLRQFDFGECSALGLALEEMYGARGGRGLAQHAGQVAFSDALKTYGALAGVADLAFMVLPLQAKLRIGLPAWAKFITRTSDQQTTAEERETDWVWTIHQCPYCWGRTGMQKPACQIVVGTLQEGLKWVSGGIEFRVNESRCIAVGDTVCEFVIQKPPLV